MRWKCGAAGGTGRIAAGLEGLQSGLRSLSRNRCGVNPAVLDLGAREHRPDGLSDGLAGGAASSGSRELIAITSPPTNRRRLNTQYVGSATLFAIVQPQHHRRTTHGKVPPACPCPSRNGWNVTRSPSSSVDSPPVRPSTRPGRALVRCGRPVSTRFPGR
jgi:hypothetical protein